MLRIARNIAAGGRLDAVVATHRHRDHISGFGGACGRIIASLRPAVVVQPWTEDPDAAPGCPAFSEIQNRSAIANLSAMGKRGRAMYLYAGSPSGLEDLLPGVEISVLGPPTLVQSAAIRHERDHDPNEFWEFLRFQPWPAGMADKPDLFPGAPRFHRAGAPPSLRWFLARLQRLGSEQAREFVRVLDRVLNNTSVILLFRVGDFRMLFPGDAQIENWSWALGQKQYRDLLRGVNVYKVGHHGSRNATPRSLWRLFAHRSANAAEPCRLLTLLSTCACRHGREQDRTEVPRRTLVETMARESNLFTTQELPCSKPWRDFDFPLSGPRHAR